MAEEDDQLWVRPASPLECRFESGHQHGCLLISYCCTFSATRPVTEDEITRALMQVFRTTPNLRLCLGYRDGVLWLREMEHEIIDFKIVHNGDVRAEYEGLFNRRYASSTGPLWCARLLPCSLSQPWSYFPESWKVFPIDHNDENTMSNNYCENSTQGNTEEPNNLSASNGKYLRERTDPDQHGTDWTPLPYRDDTASENIGNMIKFEGNTIRVPESKHPYQYQLLLGFNHLIADGYTIMRLFARILRSLNDVIAGKSQNEQTQTASIIDISNESSLMEEIRRSFSDDPVKFEEKKRDYEEFTSRKPLIMDAYPAQKGRAGRTANLLHFLEKNTTELFIQKCKHEGVTFHSGFSNVVGCATVEMLLLAGFERKSFEISHVNIVNHRRYNESVNNAFGTCIGYINTTTTIPSDYLNEFWLRAKQQDVDLREKIRQRKSLETDILKRLLLPHNLNASESFRNPPHPYSYFSMSNKLDATAILGDCGDHVQAEWLNGGTSNHRSSNICVHVMHTLRGRLHYGLNYSSQYMTETTARTLAQTVFRTLHKVLRL